MGGGTARGRMSQTHTGCSWPAFLPAPACPALPCPSASKGAEGAIPGTAAPAAALTSPLPARARLQPGDGDGGGPAEAEEPDVLASAPPRRPRARKQTPRRSGGSRGALQAPRSGVRSAEQQQEAAHALGGPKILQQIFWGGRFFARKRLYLHFSTRLFISMVC